MAELEIRIKGDCEQIFGRHFDLVWMRLYPPDFRPGRDAGRIWAEHFPLP